jgi:glycosyltransferase involved in cell wall biosynthesis
VTRAASEAETSVPLITVGMVVLNREWIIGKVLDSLMRQTYPHDKIFVVFVDGGSKDKTVKIAKEILEKSDLASHEIITKECSIPDGRNICIEKMRGDILFFWDSDIVMQPTAVQDLVNVALQKKAGVVSADGVFIFVNSVKEIDDKIQETLASGKLPSENCLVESPSAGMGHTLVSKEVLNSVRFDPDLTIAEDLDFSVRAREKGFKIILDRCIPAFDINIRKKGHSDIHVDMPFRRSIRGLRKKAKAHVLGYSLELTSKKAVKFFLENKRYIFYLGYIPVTIVTIYGLVVGSFLVFALPIYLLLFAFWQIMRRGVKRGVKALLKSIVVGVPFSLWLVYYFAKYVLRKNLRKQA